MSTKHKIFLFFVVIYLFVVNAAFAIDEINKNFAHESFLKANSLYQQEKYDQAIKRYNEILGKGLESASIYYNLANSYFKIGSIGKAILNYERARRLEPADTDIITNLEYAGSLATDRSIQVTLPRFTQIINSFPKRYSADGVCKQLFFINILIFSLLIINLFLARPNKVLIFLVITLTLVVAVDSMILGRKAIDINNRKRGIIIADEVDCNFGPIENSTTYFTLYEGSKIIILKNEGEWSKIKRFDGKIGWIKRGSLEAI